MQVNQFSQSGTVNVCSISPNAPKLNNNADSRAKARKEGDPRRFGSLYSAVVSMQRIRMPGSERENIGSCVEGTS